VSQKKMVLCKNHQAKRGKKGSIKKAIFWGRGKKIRSGIQKGGKEKRESGLESTGHHKQRRLKKGGQEAPLRCRKRKGGGGVKTNWGEGGGDVFSKKKKGWCETTYNRETPQGKRTVNRRKKGKRKKSFAHRKEKKKREKKTSERKRAEQTGEVSGKKGKTRFATGGTVGWGGKKKKKRGGGHWPWAVPKKRRRKKKGEGCSEKS